LGIERIILLLNGKSFEEKDQILISLIMIKEENDEMNELIFKNLLQTSQILRINNFKTSFSTKDNTTKQLKYSNLIHSNFSIIFGGNEIRENKVIIKNMANSSNSIIDLSSIVSFFQSL
jgi:histidyl-tRNA synthetase